ncbi:hypothetical protein Tco_1179098 [Tanacetum coccineum]
MWVVMLERNWMEMDECINEVNGKMEQPTLSKTRRGCINSLPWPAMGLTCYNLEVTDTFRVSNKEAAAKDKEEAEKIAATKKKEKAEKLAAAKKEQAFLYY